MYQVLALACAPMPRMPPPPSPHDSVAAGSQSLPAREQLSVPSVTPNRNLGVARSTPPAADNSVPTPRRSPASPILLLTLLRQLIKASIAWSRYSSRMPTMRVVDRFLDARACARGARRCVAVGYHRCRLECWSRSCRLPRLAQTGRRIAESRRNKSCGREKQCCRRKLQQRR